MKFTPEQEEFNKKLQESIDNNTFAPENLNSRQRKAIDILIKNKAVNSKPLDDIISERLEARQKLAQAQTVKKDPIATALNIDESKIPGGDFILSGRSSAVLAGDLSLSVAAIMNQRNKIIEAYDKTDKTKLNLNRGKKFFFENAANKLPPRFKFLGGALRLAGRTLDLPERLIKSPLGRSEAIVAGAGTLGAGAGSLGYDAINNLVGPSIIEGMLEDLGEMPEQKIEKMNPLDTAIVEMKNAALFNFGAAALTPLLMASGRGLNFLFGTTGKKQKELAQFARDNGYEIPILAAMRDGPLSGLGQSYFKTVGVFPYISRIMDRRMLSAEKTFAKGYLDSNIATIAPIYSHSFLSQKLYRQSVETFKKNAETIDKAYDEFFNLSTIAGDPPLLKLNNTQKSVERFLNQFSAEFPDLAVSYRRGFQEDQPFDMATLANLTGQVDPLNQFMRFMGTAAKDPITFSQFKGFTVMLNRALEQTKYQTASRTVADMRASLEKDAHGFLKELNDPNLLRNPEIKQLMISIGGGDTFAIAGRDLAERRLRDEGVTISEQTIKDEIDIMKRNPEQVETILNDLAAQKIAKTEAGKERLNTIKNAGSQMHGALKNANEVFSRIMKFYTGKEGDTALGALRRFDKSLFTQKTLFNIQGAAVLPKDQLFKKIQTAVFSSRSPEALKEFRKMVGAQPGFDGFSETGQKLYQAAVARFMHNAFMSSFRSKPINTGIFGRARVPFSAPFENGAFRKMENDPRFTNNVDDILDQMGRVDTQAALRAQGGEISTRLSPDGLEDVTSIRFGPDDYRDFDGNKFRQILGLDEGNRDVYKFIEEMYGGGQKGAKALQHIEEFAEYVKRLSDVPITNSSSFIQRRLTLGGASSLAGIALGFGGSAAASPFAPFVLFATALRAGKILSDPFLLRQVNDVLSPKEVEAILKGGDAFGKKQAGITNPKLILAGLTRKREAFARFMNKAFGDDDDFKPVDPENINLKEISEYLNNQQVQMIKPNYGGDGENLPTSTLVKMYNEELQPQPTESEIAEEENFIEGGLAATKEFNQTFTPDALETDIQPSTAIEPLVQNNLINNQQVTSQQVAELFPNDPITIAAARRREISNV